MRAKAEATTIVTPSDARNLQPSQEKKCRREHEAQQDSESEWEQHLASDIKSGDDDGGDQQALKRRGARV